MISNQVQLPAALPVCGPMKNELGKQAQIKRSQKKVISLKAVSGVDFRA
jgi:hypothetical protein